MNFYTRASGLPCIQYSHLDPPLPQQMVVKLALRQHEDHLRSYGGFTHGGHSEVGERGLGGRSLGSGDACKGAWGWWGPGGGECGGHKGATLGRWMGHPRRDPPGRRRAWAPRRVLALAVGVTRWKGLEERGARA